MYIKNLLHSTRKDRKGHKKKSPERAQRMFYELELF